MTSFKLLFVLLLLAISFVHAGKVEKTYLFENPSVALSGAYKTLNFPGSLLTGMPGEPLLPYQQVRLLLPPGESAIRIEFELEDEIELPGKMVFPPQQHVQPVSKGASGNVIRNEDIYRSAEAYPASISGRLITSFMNGHSFALSTFTPVRYIPGTGTVKYFRKVRVIIHSARTDEAVSALANLRSSPEVRKQLERFADNSQLLNTYHSDFKATTDDYQILIITPGSFAGSFESLKQAYLKEGMLTQVVSTETISSSMTGIDLQEKMRNYIIQEYQQRGVQHVILGGDDELIPNRGFYCHVQSSSVYEDYNIPSDLYYSALDGNWNTDGDNMWAEPGEDDLLPDISVGRLSFSNAFELARMIHKSYSYQFTPVHGEFQKVILAGENLYYDPETWGSDYLELLIGSHEDNGYSTTGIPESYAFNKMYDEIIYWSGYDLIGQINQGYPMLHHVGHANETYVMKLSNWDITDENFSSVNGTTHNYVLVYTHGCLCGSFDFNDCIAEQMVSINNFAVAFVGNSRYGWFNEGQTEGPSAHLHREFLDALYTDKYNRLGRAHMESKIATAPWVTAPGQWEPGALRWCFYDCNVLGDPVLAVWTNNAMNIATSYPSIVQTGTSSLQVTVTSGGAGAAGLTCAVLMNGNLLGTALTDEAGNAQVVFSGPITSIGMAELVVSGYNCQPTVYQIIVTGTVGLPVNENTKQDFSISPNPVAGELTIHYELSSQEVVSIELVSQDGRTISILEGATEMPGRRTITWNASSLSSGVYQCILKSGNQVKIARFIKK